MCNVAKGFKDNVHKKTGIETFSSLEKTNYGICEV